MSFHHEVSDLQYIFRLFYAQSPGILYLYQKEYRFYADEYPQDPSYQENFDNMAEMKRRIFGKESLIFNGKDECLTFDKMANMHDIYFPKQVKWTYKRVGD